MESPKSHVAKLLQIKQGRRRNMLVFLGLALAVVIVTATVLVLHAQAMNYTRRELTCAYQTHQHTREECGEPDALTCGLADYVVHMHNGDCYNEDGALVCPLREEKPHTHDASCYEEHRQLICELDGITEEEAAALAASYDPEHEHTEACYAPGERVLSCGQEEREAHTHTEACYAPGERLLGCGQAEQEAHAHSEACYTPGERVLSCTLPEDESHTHSDACYTEGAPVLACGQEERAGHAHTDACYTDGAPVLACGQEEHEAHAHTDECYTQQEPVLTCEKGEEAQQNVPPHVHGEECYETVEELSCGKLELHTHTDECYRIIRPEDPDYETYKQEDTPENEEIRLLICEIPQLEEHVHGEECFTTVELSPDEIAALKAQEMGIELRDLQLVYEDADVRVTVDYDTLSLVPQPAEVALLNADTPRPAPTPNPLLPAEVLPEEGTPAAPEGEGAPADAAPDAATPAEPAAEPAPAEPAPAEPSAEPAPADAPAPTEPQTPDAAENHDEKNEAATAGTPAAAEPAAPAEAGGSEAPELVRAGLMAEGREWLPAATVTYTVQYLDNGMPAGEPVQYVYTPGGELPVFPRSIARYYRECRTDAFIVTARYTALANIPAEAELRASIITDAEQLAAYESAYKEALNTSKAQMLSLMDIGFWLGEQEVQPAAPVSITVQLLGEDGLPAGEPITVVHFAEAGTEVLPANVDESGAASFAMNGFSLIGLGFTPEADEEGRVTLDHTFDWVDENGLFQVTFHIKGVAGPYKEEADADAAPDADAPEAGEPAAGETDGEADAPAPAQEEEEENTAPEAPAAGEEAAAGAPEAGEDTDAVNEPDVVEAPLANAAYLNFTVETLGEGDEAYEAYAEYAAGETEAADLLNLAVMRYALTYGEAALDLSACEVEVTITPTAKMEQTAAENNEEVLEQAKEENPDGYVLSADGTEMLPVPEPDMGLMLTAIIPTDDEEQPVAECRTIVIGEEEDQIQTVSMDEEISDEETVAAEAITFTMSPRMMASAPTAYTVGALLSKLPNPSFTVEYWAELDLVLKSGDEGVSNGIMAALDIIDTSGGVMPINAIKGGNKNTPPTTNIYVYNSGPDKGKVATKNTIKEIYKEKTDCTYYTTPSLNYFNALHNNKGYELKRIEILYADGHIESVEYSKQHVHFTNRNVGINDEDQKEPNEYVITQGTETYLVIKSGCKIRLIYKPVIETFIPDTAFFDYDISSGYHNGFMDTHKGGINGDDVPTVLNGGTEQVRYAFGNRNAGVKYGWDEWNGGNRLNSGNFGTHNGTDSYKGCTFGIVAGISGDGKDVVFSDGICAPKNLFNESVTTTGKHNYAGTLTFNKVGDTYTLTAANATGLEPSLTGLDKLFHPARSGDIWTNEFWPMDTVPKDKRTDILFGNPNDLKKYYGYGQDIDPNKVERKKTMALPISDHNIAHNSYFGMRYAVNFELVEEYIGPLEYLFFGDDDMWVFLSELNEDGTISNTKLICDIGGVHSSVGEYVNLWDYIGTGDAEQNRMNHGEGKYKLSFFYTERGASGSTCWMQFTLPSVTSDSVKPEEEYATLRVGKEVQKSVNDSNDWQSGDNGESFKFNIQLRYPDGTPMLDDYNYALYNQDGTSAGKDLVLRNNSDFWLKSGQYIVIDHLPDGVKYTIKEYGDENFKTSEGKPSGSGYNYSTEISVTNGANAQIDNNTRSVSGSIQKGKNVQVTVKFVNKYRVFELPETGNTATPEVYVLCGGALALAAVMVIRKRRKKARA